jgi:hypothetical protein
LARVSAPIPDTEPTRINAGDTARWLKSLADYPASAGWALAYTLVSAAQRYTFSGTASGDDFLVNVAASTTTGWAAGSYAWRAQVSRAGEVYTVAEGQVEVAPAFGAAVDARSAARRGLDAINAVLENRATAGVAEVTIGGRAVKHIPLPELLALRDRYRIDVAREEAAARSAAGLAPAGRVAVRFGPW